MPSELERQLTALKQGDHGCLIYENPAEQMAVLARFVRERLDRKVSLYRRRPQYWRIRSGARGGKAWMPRRNDSGALCGYWSCS